MCVMEWLSEWLSEWVYSRKNESSTLICYIFCKAYRGYPAYRYAASMIGLIILCLVQEGLSRLRTSIARQYSLQSSSEDAENAAVVHPETASPPFFGRWKAVCLLWLSAAAAVWWPSVCIVWEGARATSFAWYQLDRPMQMYWPNLCLSSLAHQIIWDEIWTGFLYGQLRLVMHCLLCRMYNPPAVRIALSLLYALNLTTSYLLMLAVMTYNVGYFLAIICGLALGHLIFFPAALAKAPTAPSNCC